jgi:hypothetical protein
MMDTKDLREFVEISAPTVSPTLPTASSVQSGPAIEPLQRLFLYSADEWEGFVDEWASTCLKKKYTKVQRFTGSNDRGIDIAGFADDHLLAGVWDNYQCKHYDHALYPTDAWPEIAKILWYSFNGDYKPPRAYFFVAPREAGTTLSQLLANPGLLKAKLLKVWDTNCRDHITDKQSIALTGDFCTYEPLAKLQWCDEFSTGMSGKRGVRGVLG